MKALQKPIPMLTQSDLVLADTLGKIYKIVLQPQGRSVAKKILDDATLNQLILHLLAAPSDLLPSC